MFFDLNVGIGVPKDALKDESFHLVAFNRKHVGKPLKENTEPSDDLQSVVRYPERVVARENVYALQRLTISIDDIQTTHKLSSFKQMMNTYDLLAIETSNEKVFQYACTDAAVDIVCLDLTTRGSFYPSFSTVNAAIQRGIYFEIIYSPMMKEGERKMLVSNAMNLIRVTRGKNIIISSGATSRSELRGPRDVINLACLFGLNEDEARRCLIDNPRQVVLHAYARRNVYKSVIEDMNPSSPQKHQNKKQKVK